MAVSRAEKDVEFGELQMAFREAETAVLVDYRGITVPQVEPTPDAGDSGESAESEE